VWGVVHKLDESNYQLAELTQGLLHAFIEFPQLNTLIRAYFIHIYASTQQWAVAPHDIVLANVIQHVGNARTDGLP